MVVVVVVIRPSYVNDAVGLIERLDIILIRAKKI